MACNRRVRTELRFVQYNRRVAARDLRLARTEKRPSHS
jgi:hypothetical protein